MTLRGDDPKVIAAAKRLWDAHAQASARQVNRPEVLTWESQWGDVQDHFIGLALKELR